MMRFSPRLILLSALTLSAAACALHPEPMREVVADRLASAAWMLKREINAAPFTLTLYERMHEKEAPANIYIAGDGQAVIPVIDKYNTGYKLNVTPKNPVALHLATKDKADNVAYIARPCQYTGMTDGSICDPELWISGQYSPQVLNAINAAINDVKSRYGITTINLIGYSGGATLAAILSAQRTDVLSLRTVNGKLDLNALSPALPSLRNMPQHHFVGQHDEIVGTRELATYQAALGDLRCSKTTILHEATHDKGFVNPWPELLKDKAPRCETPEVEPFEPIMPRPTVFVPHMGDSKK